MAPGAFSEHLHLLCLCNEHLKHKHMEKMCPSTGISNHGPLELKASMLLMSHADPLLGYQPLRG